MTVLLRLFALSVLKMNARQRLQLGHERKITCIHNCMRHYVCIYTVCIYILSECWARASYCGFSYISNKENSLCLICKVPSLPLQSSRCSVTDPWDRSHLYVRSGSRGTPASLANDACCHKMQPSAFWKHCSSGRQQSAKQTELTV